ncbi:hypothetical protein D3H55_16755 [Bacillus salacetis]|uniref:Uncharacterized protein n=1 Tax=Bacillus salacetis TaxID=2315464 RepID=A0A3A1QT34_9BACI|nr:hypothetical protein [Bacillus salacetis]RIW30388.1 hypothetical protein D3H55_16755 [Bacillus salacetis]
MGQPETDSKLDIYGTVIKNNYEHAYFATINENEDYVFVEAGENYEQERVYYISFDGDQIFSFDKLTGNVSWLNRNKQIQIKCKNAIGAHRYSEHNIIIVVNQNGISATKLNGYALDGTLLFEKDSSDGFDFVYLTTFRSSPYIVYDGGKANADSFGRSWWNFSIDPRSGKLNKEHLAY